jgi:alpha-1,6-mannosyltransferase
VPRGVIWRFAVLALVSVAGAALLVWGSVPGASSMRQLQAVLASSAAGAAALIWLAAERRFAHVGVGAFMALAFALRLIAAQAEPLLEDDHFRYLWDGWRTATALDPYRLAPSAWFGDAQLPLQWQEVLNGINHPDVPTIYGPVLQAVFALAHAVAPGRVGAIQGLLLAADMLLLWSLHRHGASRRWLLAYAIHPLVLREAMASAHPDALLALCLVLACAAWQRAQPWRLGVWLGLALGVKVAALVALPLLMLRPATARDTSSLRWAMHVGLACAATLFIAYLPFLAAGGSDAAGLGAFATQWRFNPLLYRVLDGVLPDTAARPIALLIVAAGVAAIAWRWRRDDAAEAWPPLDAALLLLLLLSPVVNPWYWLWLLALGALRQRSVALVAGACAAVSYINGSVLEAAGADFVVGWPLALLQLGVIAAAAAFDAARPRSAPTTSR